LNFNKKAKYQFVMKIITKVSLLSVLIIFLLFSCENKKSSPVKLSGDDTKDIVGIWKSESGKKIFWIEFKINGFYDQGTPNEIREQDQPYEINVANKQLTLKSDKGDRVFSYKFKNGNLVITAKDKDREFEKVTSKPAGN
jgi:hypothetical protein